ncbi:hypothetical protein AAFF_G00277200 [Aldrovandia affinis]|uniref:DHX34-like C2H2-type zinc finger domain-containing protein n=1 Tax=Aldrovandia affinis TaxID=143900 RepID=A0AAD7RAV4_9TELE|nr:hypothetical protein AAFF_G00277200 [Aldrovandia affinis]
MRALSSSLTLRGDWERLLQAKLRNGAGELAGPAVSQKDLEKLSEGLVRFLLYTEVSYSLRRLAGLESQNLYIGPQQPQGLPPPRPGRGLSVTSFFTFNCLSDSKDLYSECLRTFWSCPQCDLYMPLTPLERMHHEATCRPEGELQPEQEPEKGAGSNTSSSSSSLTRAYHCDVCDRELSLTSTEILKHKRQHL